MKIKTELDKLTSSDIYSLLLFALYKSNELPEYSSLSQLAYILNKDDLLTLCEVFGGTTITIPTVDELEKLLNALLIFQLVDIEKQNYDATIMRVKEKNIHFATIEKDYLKVKQLMSIYDFNSGR